MKIYYVDIDDNIVDENSPKRCGVVYKPETEAEKIRLIREVEEEQAAEMFEAELEGWNE